MTIGEINTSKTRNAGKEMMFEFQGSFGGDELHSNLESAQRSKLKLPKISLDSVLDLQKSEAFNNRCQKCKAIIVLIIAKCQILRSNRAKSLTAKNRPRRLLKLLRFAHVLALRTSLLQRQWASIRTSIAC